MAQLIDAETSKTESYNTRAITKKDFLQLQ